MYSTIICGVTFVLLLIAFLWMRLMKKWFKRQVKVLIRKKQDLDKAILSANDMVHEINNISDYLVGVVNEQVAVLKSESDKIEEKIEECKLMFEGRENVVEFPKRVENKVENNTKKLAIERLANSGFDVGCIAKELGMGKGEVQLIMGMGERVCEVV